MTEYIFLDNARIIIVLAFTATDAINFLKLNNIIAQYKGIKKIYGDVNIKISIPTIVFDSDYSC